MPTITLPTLHADQVRVFNARADHNAVCCGRRWGKDVMQNTIACDAAIKGQKVGVFTPEHKQWQEPYSAMLDILAPIIKVRNKSDGKLVTKTGGVIDFWSLTDNILAGRGREYHRVLVNEAAFTKTPQMLREIWDKSIKPTMLTTRGKSWIFSTPLGINQDNFFYHVCHGEGATLGGNPDFKFHHAPSVANPLVPADEIEKLRAKEHPLVFQQEYLAEFVDWSGAAFFSLDKWLVDGKPVPMPTSCVLVFAMLDTALKSGKEHDGTAVIYCALVEEYTDQGPVQRLILISYELIQIDADLLPSWFPNVYRQLEHFAKLCGARMGSKGAIIEDKGSGTILLQHAQRQGWAATAVDSAFVSMGKDERSLSVSSYHHQGLCKIAAPCYDKLVEFKGVTRNHLVTQVTGFRLADKDAYRRADDLHDGYTACLSVTFGNNEGY
jgi:hypothetical protein